MNYPVIIILGLLAIVGIILVIVFVAKGGSGGGGSSPPGPSPPGPSPPGPSPSGLYEPKWYKLDTTTEPVKLVLSGDEWQTPCDQTCTATGCGKMRSCRDFCYDNKHWNNVSKFKISKNKTGQCATDTVDADHPHCFSKTSPLYYFFNDEFLLPVCPGSSSS